MDKFIYLSYFVYKLFIIFCYASIVISTIIVGLRLHKGDSDD